MRIDGHQHFWNPARGDYGWMPKGDGVLDRVYGPDDLRPLLAASGVGRTVLVQAAPTIHETEYMLGLADGSAEVAGVVGWVDFDRAEDQAQMRRLAGHGKLVGLRPMIQDIPDADWMLGASREWAFREMSDRGLCFDALGFPLHLGRFLTLFQRWPDLKVVIDHGMKPKVGNAGAFAEWAEGMARLAGETGAMVKLSGLVTEGPMGTDARMLKPYVDHLLAVFGPGRIIWGSDWPVVNLRCSYGEWLAMAEGLTGHLGEVDRAAIFGDNAARFYGL